MAKKLTRTTKKQITKEWNELFPSMGVYKNMWLMNILGPLAVGMLLEVGSDTTMYTPIMHVHNLAVESDVMTICLPIADDSVTTKSNPDKYKNIADCLKSRCIIPYKENVSLYSLIEGLKKYCNQLEYDIYRYDVCDILIYLAGWSNKESVILNVKNFVMDQLKQGNLECISNEKQYIKDMEAVFFCSKQLKNVVEQQIIKLELEHLPRRKIIID